MLISIQSHKNRLFFVFGVQAFEHSSAQLVQVPAKVFPEVFLDSRCDGAGWRVKVNCR